MKNYPEIGIQIGDILLPEENVNLHQWAVIACDQFTSQPEYWQKVGEIVGQSPSTLNMILPEVYLGTPEEQARIQSTQTAMRHYLEEHILVPYQGLILVERTTTGHNSQTRTRHGLMLALDLECYDFSKGSQSLIRATEGTILERLPPRIRIREGAPLEVPHILVLIDDPQRTVIEPLVKAQSSLRLLYNTDLMLGSGHLRGSLVVDPAQETRVLQALRNLAEPERFQNYYGVGKNHGVLLFAMGDGNHSLATAKSIWEKIKPQVGMDHPARYALVEIENVHDEGLAFEPIHRVLFGVCKDWTAALESYFGARMSYASSASTQEMIAAVNRQSGMGQSFGVVSSQGAGIVTIQRPPSNLPVGTLQAFLDDWLKQGGADHIDYVHGDDVVCQLGAQANNLGFYLPVMDKGDLFKTVILDGSLPRKTFSMGEAHEKRFYMESRKIV
jgi:hypothetical protein